MMKEQDKHKAQGMLPVWTPKFEASELERHIIAQALEDPELKYRTTLDAMDVAIHVVDRDLRFVLFNKSFKEWNKELGLDTEVLGKKLTEVFPFLPPKVIQQYQDVFATGKLLITEEHTKIQDKEFITETRKIPILKNKTVTSIITTVRDVTALKRNAEALKQMNECFLNFNSSPKENINRLVALCGEQMRAACALYNCLEGDMIYSLGQWNPPDGFKPRFSAQGHICYDVITGCEEGSCSPNPVVIRDLQNSPYAKTDPGVAAYNLQTYIGLSVKLGTSCVGSLCVVYQRDFIPTGEDLRFMGIIAAAIAVEENRRHAQQALQESQERYKHITETVTDYIFTVRVKDGKPRETLYGPTCVTVTGYTPEDFNNDPYLWLNMVYGEDRQQVMEQAALILAGEKVSPLEHRIIRKDGSLRWIRNTTVMHFDEQGKLISYDGLIQDITERKRSEEALQESEARLLLAQNRAHIGSWERNLVTGEVYWSDENYRIFGLDPQKVKPSYEGFLDRVEPADLELVKRSAEGAMKEGKSYDIDFHIIRPDGTRRIVNGRGQVIFDETGRAVKISGTLQDISERNRMEEELRVKERFLSSIFGSIQDGISILDKEYNIVQVNPAMEKWYAHAMPLVGKKCYEAYHCRTQMCEICPSRRTIERGESSYEIVPKRGKEGAIIGWLDLYTFPMLDIKTGKLQGVIEYVRDITDRKKAELARDLEHQQILSIFESIDDPVYVVDPETYEVLYINKAIREEFGDVTGRKCYEVLQGLDAPCPFCTNKIIFGKRAGRPHIWEFQNKKNGRWYHCIDKAIHWPDGRLVRYEMAIDITDRKIAESQRYALNRELLKTNRRLKQLALRDAQTGLYNHRYLEEVIEAEFYRATRYNHPLAVMMLDIDYFKSINDVYGHQFGDLVLKQTARQLKRMVRQYDIVIRLGGEEFLIVSPATDRSQALALAQRILDTMNLYDFGDKKHTVKVKLSVAVASYPEDKIRKGMDLVEITDKIIDKVKEYGGNNVYSSLDIKSRKKPYLPKNGKTKTDIGFLKGKIEKLTKRTNQSLVEAVFAFAKTIELKDHKTGEHVEKTVQYATEIARALGLSREEIERIKQAAILHDLGKIGISEKVLIKRLRLTRDEFAEIKKHPQIGVDIIRPIKLLHHVIPLMLYHHERWDGKGYPNGLKGEEIPLGARIVAIADVYEALTSDRPYRKAYSQGEAIKIIKKASGTQFDPKVVRAFLKIIRKIG